MARYNLNQVRGVGVTRIVKDSPAEKAGLKQGDVILRIDGENVTSVRNSIAWFLRLLPTKPFALQLVEAAPSMK
jgi:S1-C subfamily serine protease